MKVHYFGGYGRAECIRMALAHAKIAFENVNYSFGEEFNALKQSGKLEFGQVPALEVDGKFYAQSYAVLRMIGIKHGYYPIDNAENAWRVDSTLDSINDLSAAFYKAAFADEASRPALMKTFMETTLSNWLAVMEKRIQANSSQKYFVGDKITIADFGLAAWAYSVALNEQSQMFGPMNEILSHFPTFHAYLKGLGEDDLKDYLAGRPKCPW
jgi:glutathione S-transferase